VTAPTYRTGLFYGLAGGRLLHRAWEVTDGLDGPVLLSGWSLTKNRAKRAAADAAGTCEPWSSSIPALSWTPAQTAKILARYAADLHAADPITFDHMACAAECCTGQLADRMRELVDVERRARQGATR
jgi:hypothetical protein